MSVSIRVSDAVAVAVAVAVAQAVYVVALTACAILTATRLPWRLFAPGVNVGLAGRACPTEPVGSACTSS